MRASARAQSKTFWTAEPSFQNPRSATVVELFDCTCLALTPHAYNVYTLLTNARGIIHCPLFYVGMYTFNARVVKLTVLICSKVHAEVGMCACVRTITRRCHVSVYKPLKQKSAKDPTSGQAAHPLLYTV
jgi:hypothetical protein